MDNNLSKEELRNKLREKLLVKNTQRLSNFSKNVKLEKIKKNMSPSTDAQEDTKNNSEKLSTNDNFKDIHDLIETHIHTNNCSH